MVKAGNNPAKLLVSARRPDKSSYLPGKNIRFERIMPAHGLSYPMVSSVIQDSNGFMWFASENGLNKFDGYSFTTYKHNPRDLNSLNFNEIKAIFEDSDGNIWIGGVGGIDKFNPTSESFIHVDDSGVALCILEDSRGTIWVGFQHGLYGFDRSNNQIEFSFPRNVIQVDENSSISPGEIRSIIEDSKGFLWIGTSAGLDKFNTKTKSFEHFNHNPADSLSLISNNITTVYEDKRGDIWIGTQDQGIDRLHLATKTFKHHRYNPDKLSSLSSNNVLSILEDRSGNIWIGTIDGLNLYDRDNKLFYHYRHNPENSDSISDNIVTAIFEDRSGVLWLGTANGLSKYIPRANQFINIRNGSEHLLGFQLAENPNNLDIDFSKSKVISLFEDHEGMIWFGTLIDGVYHLNPTSGKINNYRHVPENPKSINSNEVYAIYQDRVGVFWLGTGNGWLEQFDPLYKNTIHAYQQESEIVSIAEDFSNNMWIGTQGHGLYHLKFDEQYLYHNSQPAQWIERAALGSSIIETIFVDSKGATWVGTYNDGVNIWNPDVQRFSKYKNNPLNPNSLSNNHVNAFLEDPNQFSGVMWIGTQGGGLNRFDRNNKIFTNFTVEDGLADDIINCILSDSSGNLWMSTPKGLSKFDPKTEAIRNYDTSDGISGGAAQPGVCLRSSTGEMYFGTPSGVIFFDPSQIQDNLTIPPIVITSLHVNDQLKEKDIIYDGEIKLSYQENYLSFEFAALDYTASNKNSFAYKMDGLDNDWVFAGTRQRADYPDMRPGEYVFYIKGANNDGVWNDDGISYKVTIVPPFWSTTWFIGLIIILAVVSVFIGSQVRLRSLEAQSRSLERQVEERTHEINRQRQQIEALYRADEDIYRHLELIHVLQALVDTAVHILQADKGSLWCWDEAHKNLLIKASHGFNHIHLGTVSIPRGNGVAGWVAEHGKPATIEDARLDPRVTPQIIEKEGIQAFVQVPIKVGQEVFGVFSADYLEPRSFDKDDVRLLVSLAQRAAIAIQNAQLYNQGRELAAVQERNRLARELHDAVTQTLFSASLIAEALPALWERDPIKGQDRLEKLRQMSRGALAEMRALLLELRPTALLETNLGDLLRQLGEVAAGREGVPVIMEIDTISQLPEDLHIALYRISQEALNNICKHARPNRITIGLHQKCSSNGDLQEISLWVYDNGKGFDLENISPNSMGLHIMRERAQSVDANFQIQSQPGYGSRIDVSWKKTDNDQVQESTLGDDYEPFPTN